MLQAQRSEERPSGAVRQRASRCELDFSESAESLNIMDAKTAQAFIDWRTSNGAFTSIDELLEVDGIGPKTFDSLEPLVTL